MYDRDQLQHARVWDGGAVKELAVMDVDDTLVLILERIDSPVSLLLAASTCRRWRRIIAEAGFLRRCRSLLGSPVACNYYNGDPIHDPWSCNTVVGHRPLFVPSSSIDAHRFSLDFLVGASIFPARDQHNWSWKVRESRGSLLLMEYTKQMRSYPTSIYEEYSHEMRMSSTFPDLVVCEPLTQRYKVIPQQPDFYRGCYMLRGPFLIDGDEDETGGRIGMSNFRVQCVLFSCDDAVAYTTMFTAAGDMDAMWSKKAIDHMASRLHPTKIISRCLGHALGLYYFYVHEDGMLFTRNASTGKFSSSVLPKAIQSCWYRHIYTENFTVVNGGDGEPRIVIMTNNTMEVFARSLYGEWALENKVKFSNVTYSLPTNNHLTIVKKGVGFIVISPEPKQQLLFSVDLKTMEMALITKSRRERMVYPCEFPWPPVVQVCLDT